MRKQYYLPYSDESRDSWASNFAAKIGAYAAKYDLSTAEVDDVKLGAVTFTAIRAYAAQFSSFVHGVTAYKNALRDGLPPGATLHPLVVPTAALPAALAAPDIFGRIATIVRQIKAVGSPGTELEFAL